MEELKNTFSVYAAADLTKGENPAHLESRVHQHVHVGAAADRSLPATSFRSRGQEEAAGRGQPGVRGRLS